jgi:hypothetical protein
MSHRQYEDYERWGLLSGSGDPAELIERIIEEGQQARSLPRRTIRLRADYQTFPVPAAKVREAMVCLLPEIAAPVSKMRRLGGALGRSQQPGYRTEYGLTVGAGPARPLPSFRQWPELMSNAAVGDIFEARVTWYYFMGREALVAYTRGTQYDVSDIALEERVTLLAVRDIARFTP